MELRELCNRLFRLHANLILAFVLIGTLAGLAMTLGSGSQYQASALFTMGSQDPQSAEVAGVLAATARGIATAPQVVNQAISSAGVNRNEQAVASAISIQTQGSSGIVMLSVTDRDPRAAIALANALAAQVVSTRAAVIQHGRMASLRSLAQQEASTNAQIQKLNSQIQELQGQNSPSALTQLSALEARLTALQVLATQLIVQQDNLQSAMGPQVTVIDKAVSAVGMHGRQLDNALLGGVLGLVLGIAVAGTREVVRPSLVGSAAVCRAISAPLLGEMNAPPASWTVAALPDAGSYVQLAAEANNVQEVRFAALEPKHRHSRARVRMLEGPLHRLRFSESRSRDQAAPSIPDDPSADHGLSARLSPAAPAAAVGATDQNGGGDPPRIGLVVAVPKVVKVADVDALTNFTWLSGWILLGVITYTAPRKAITRASRGAGPVGSGRDSSVTKQAEVDAW
jgi:capsular polysaccharide biosynthesis protein